MITTPEPVLRRVSYQIGEEVPDTSAVRVSYFNEAYQYYLSLNKWSFKIKEYNLTTDSNKEYDLTTLIADYSQPDGVYSVETSGGGLVKPISYEDKDLYSDQYYYLTPDGKSIGFTSYTAGDIFKIKYYAVLTEATSATSTLNISIPEHHIRPIVTYIRFLIHDRKRQRNDARNCLLDFKEQLEETLMKDANEKKIGFFPRVFSPIKKIIGLSY